MTEFYTPDQLIAKRFTVSRFTVSQTAARLVPSLPSDVSNEVSLTKHSGLAFHSGVLFIQV